MKSISRIIVVLSVADLLVSACTSAPTISTADLQTVVAQTVAAMQTETSTEVPVQPTSTQAAPTELPTFTPVPTLALTATPVPPTATTVPALVVGSVEDLTIPAWTTLKGGASFVKTWRITNGGTAAWSANYHIVYISGDKLGVSSVALGKAVNPGASIQISITCTAPVAAGSHTTNFMMETDNGYRFGMGASSGVPWAIKIKTSSVFAVTAASLAANPTSYSGACPASIDFKPTISTNSSGQVTYYIRFDNGVSSTYTLDFSAAGSASGTTVTWPIDSSMTSLTAHVYIDNPNHQDFGSLTVAITCTP